MPAKLGTPRALCPPHGKTLSTIAPNDPSVLLLLLEEDLKENLKEEVLKEVLPHHLLRRLKVGYPVVPHLEQASPCNGFYMGIL
jgi:hypothetical protein